MPYIGKTPTAAPLSASDLDDDIISLAKMASGTDGNLITYDASGNPVAVAAGNDGQVLTSAGAGQPCAFEAASSGAGLNYLATQTISADTTVDFTSNIDSTYNIYAFSLTTLVPSEQQNLEVIFSEVGGTWLTTGSPTYQNITWGYDADDNVRREHSNSTGALLIAKDVDMDVGSGTNGWLYLYTPSNANTRPAASWSLQSHSNNGSERAMFQIGGGFWGGVLAVDGVRFKGNVGNIATGVIRMYGIANS